MINSKQLREYVIVPTLEGMRVNSPAAVELLVMTFAAESNGGYFLHQVGGGPACGGYQMEPATHDDCWDNFLRYKGRIGKDEVEQYLASLAAPDQEDLANRVRRTQIPGLYDDNNAFEMCGNLYYATAMARVHYLRVPQALPAASDIEGMARYHKQHYNTYLGAATVAGTMRKYRAFA